MFPSRFLLVFLELKHENSVRVGVVFLEEKTMKVPRDLHVHAVDFDTLVPSELPLQALNLKYLLSVDGER